MQSALLILFQSLRSTYYFLPTVGINNSYKTFETLNLKKYIAQKSCSAPLTESTKAYANSHKIFETLNLERYIAQKSSNIPSIKLIKECIDNYKSFETLNLEKYITERSFTISKTEPIKMFDLIKTVKENKEISVGNFQI